MRQYPFPETKVGKALFGVFLLAMLFLARDTLFSSCIIGFTKSQVLMLGLICLLGSAFLVVNRREWKAVLTDRRMAAFAISGAVMLLPMLIKRDWQLMYFSILICLFFAVFLTFFTDHRVVAKYFVVILSLLGLYSIVATYGFRRLAWQGILSPAVFFNSQNWDFYNFGFAYAVTWEAWHRNFGIFREPGVYQFFVLLGLYLNNYAVDWDRSWKLWLVNVVLVTTMVTTFAVGGYIELALFAVFLYFDKKWYRTKWGKFAGLAALLLLAGAVAFVVFQIAFSPYFTQSVFYEFYDMFIRLTTDSNSMLDRLDAIFTNLEFFFHSPLVGETVAQVLHGTNHNTSSTLILYAILGMAGGTLSVASWVALTWKKERNLFGNLILLVILFMSFNTQNLVADVFFWLFPMMALVERGLPRIKFPARKV